MHRRRRFILRRRHHVSSPAAAAAGPQAWLGTDAGRLEYLDLPARRSGRPALLLMHEGLGGVRHWRDFPARLAAATGCRTVAYSRLGFGRSPPRLTPWTPRFMHEEALQLMPAIRRRLDLDRVVLLGHSTGASMSLIHAGEAGLPTAGVVAIAPIAFIEDSNLQSIGRMRERYPGERLRESLARYHDDPDAVFFGWADTWLDPAFRHWSLAPSLPGIRCPILTIRGERDEYVSGAQTEAIRRLATASPRIDTLELPACGHAPHRDQPEAVIDALLGFLEGLPANLQEFSPE